MINDVEITKTTTTTTATALKVGLVDPFILDRMSVLIISNSPNTIVESKEVGADSLAMMIEFCVFNLKLFERQIGEEGMREKFIFAVRN